MKEKFKKINQDLWVKIKFFFGNRIIMFDNIKEKQNTSINIINLRKRNEKF